VKWCIGDNDGWPECNGPDCGEVEDCPYYKALMEEDPACREDLEDWKQRQKEKHEQINQTTTQQSHAPVLREV